MTNINPTVSIVIPTYNAEATIGPLLDSLRRLNYSGYEVIVGNDGSKDRTQEIIERYSFHVINQPNRGASAARDAGLRLAKGEIVAYVDSDVAVSPDWLAHLVQPFSDPSVAATTGQTIFRRNETCASWLRSLDIEKRNARRKRYTHLANGPNSAFRKDVLLQVGGFDPKWYHAEDTEVSYRIGQLGLRIQYVPEAVVYHVPEEDWHQYLRKRYRDAKAFTRMLKKYTRHAMIEDEYVSLGMKIQPPLFLATLIVALVCLPFLLVGGWRLLLALLALVLVGLAINLPEAFSLARASRRIGFLFKGLALTLLRGFAWGLGLGVGGLRQVVRG